MELTEKQISALAQHESRNRANALGDDSRAFGLYQMHNDFRHDWYATGDLLALAAVDHSALVHFAAGYYDRFAVEWANAVPGGVPQPLDTLELLLLCYNQGIAGAVNWLLDDAGREPGQFPYVKKYLEVLNSLG